MSKLRHLVIPDCQVKAGVPLDHIKYAAMYAVEKKPTSIICLGDFADMPSLSEYDKGKKSFEGRRYTIDIEVAVDAMASFMLIIRDEQHRLIRNKDKQWKPNLIMCLGNHENRINRVIESDPKLEGLISTKDLKYESRGWQVYPYLSVVVLDNIAYSHYFISGVMGRPVTSARMLLQKHHMSCIAGHQQGRDIAYGQRADGSSMTAIISGSFYSHTEDYLNPQTNEHWRGIWMLNDIKNHGSFDEMPISLSYLKERYETKHRKV